jgi:hypothetical protein
VCISVNEGRDGEREEHKHGQQCDTEPIARAMSTTPRIGT